LLGIRAAIRSIRRQSHWYSTLRLVRQVRTLISGRAHSSGEDLSYVTAALVQPACIWLLRCDPPRWVPCCSSRPFQRGITR